MKCPHCGIGIHKNLTLSPPFVLPDGVHWFNAFCICPECKESILYLQAYRPGNQRLWVHTEFMVYPSHASSRPLPAEVPDPYRSDFYEAEAVLPISAKASAALSRRNLQSIIRNKVGIKGRDLNEEIQTLIDSATVPSHISESLHAVRVIGNFAAHPIKSTSSGEIVEVEEGEADWNLDVLESLFDFYFVQPAITAKRKADLNKKLKEAGKPLLA
jgi:hypothetical protein